MTKNNELVVVAPDQYAVCKMQMSVSEIIKANLGEGAKIRAYDLDQIKVPSGGGKFWQYEDIDGEQSTQEIQGVIVAIVNTRCFWAESYGSSGGGSAPTCTSFDLMHGQSTDPETMGIKSDGRWNGDCTRCPFSEFGSAIGEDGKPSEGQACQERKFIFLTMEKGALPFVINVPPGSLMNVQKYLLRLTSNLVSPQEKVTKFTLEQTQNKKGTKYSKIKMSVAGNVPNPEFWQKYAEGMAPIIAATAQRMTKEQAEE